MLIHGQLHLTKNGLMLDEVRSLLQKSLRRGKSAQDLAFQAGKELLFHGEDQLPWHSIFTFLFEDHCLTDEKIVAAISAAHSKGDKYACIEILLKCRTCRIASCLSVISLEPEYDLVNLNLNIDVPDAIQGLIIGKNKCVKYDILLAHLLRAWERKDEENLMRYLKVAVLTHDIERRLPTQKGTLYVLEKPRRRPNIGMIVLSLFHRNTSDYKMRSYLYHCYRIAAALEAPIRLILFTVIVQVMYHDQVQRTDPEILQTGKMLWKSIPPLEEMPDWAVDKNTFRGRYGKDSAHLLKKKPSKMSPEKFEEFHGERRQQDLSDFFEEVECIENPALPSNPFWQRTVQCYMNRPSELQKTIEMEKVCHQELRMKYPELFHTRDEITSPAPTKTSTSFTSKPTTGYTIPSSSKGKAEQTMSFEEALFGGPSPAQSNSSLKRKHDITHSDSSKHRARSESESSKQMKLSSLAASMDRNGRSEKSSSRDGSKSRTSGEQASSKSSSSKQKSSSSSSSSSSHRSHDKSLLSGSHSHSSSKQKSSSSSSSSQKLSSKSSSSNQKTGNHFEAALSGEVSSASSVLLRKERLANDIKIKKEKMSSELKSKHRGVTKIKVEPKTECDSDDDFRSIETAYNEDLEESDEAYKPPVGPLLQLPSNAQKVYTCIDMKDKVVMKGPYPDAKYFRVLFYHKVMKDVFRDPHTSLVTPAQPHLKFPLCKAKEGKIEVTKVSYRDVIQNKNIRNGEFVPRRSLGLIQLHRLSPEKMRKLPYTIWLHFMFRFLLNIGDSGLHNAFTDSKLSFVKGIDMEEERGELRAVAEDTLVNYMFVVKPSKEILPSIETVLKKYADEYEEALSKFLNIAHIQRLAKQFKVDFDKNVFQERLVKLNHAIRAIRQIVVS